MKRPAPVQSPKRWWLMVALAGTLWATWQVSQDPALPKRVEPRVLSKNKPAKPASAPANLPLVWPPRTAQGGPVADLFSLAPAAAPAQPDLSLAAPLPPTFALHYMGRLDDGAASQIFLADAQDRVVVAKLGENVDDLWQLSNISATQLVFKHTATGQVHNLQIGSTQ